MTTSTEALTFSHAQRQQLATLAKDLSNKLGLAVEVETCAEDGDEWATLLLAGLEAMPVLASIQTSRDPLTPFALVRPNGSSLAAKDIQTVLALAEQSARRQAALACTEAACLA